MRPIHSSCQLQTRENHLYIYIYVQKWHKIGIYNNRRKFRSQTSDNMDRWKAEVVRVKEEKRREEKRRRKKIKKRKSQKKEDPGAGKGRKVAKRCVFPVICGSRGSKRRLAKVAVCGASWPDERWKIARRCGAKYISKSKCTKYTILGPLLEVEMSRKCTPLWREAHLQVKKLKAPQLRSTYRSCAVEKVHPVVVRSTFRSQNVKNTRMLGPLLDVQMSFGVAGARDCGPCQKWAQREGFVACPKMMAGVGHLKKICKDAFSMAGAVQETCSSELLGGPGADFLRGVAFWSLRSSGLLRWLYVTGAALRMTWHHFFVARAVV